MTQPTRPTPELLAELRKPRTYPAVSLTLPTHRHRPENQQDLIRLRNLLAEANRRLADDPEVSKDQAAAVAEQLAAASDGVDAEHFRDGLLIFASADENQTFLVGASVPERVVINTTYLTRNLVASAARRGPYLALVLSNGEVRLWRGRGEQVAEERDTGFPVITSGVERDRTPHRDGGHAVSQDFRNMLAEADRKLTPLLQSEKDLPVILVGLREQIATYREISRHGQAFAAELEVGGLLNTTPPEMAAQLATARTALAEADTARAMRGLDEARSGRRYAAGVQDAWQAAGEGRVALLVVEEGLRVTARPETVEGAERATLTLLDGGEAREAGAVGTAAAGAAGIAGTAGAGQPGAEEGVEEDIVDSLVETVLSADGEVVFVPDEALGEAQGVAAALRF
ncbi:baeRF3 domain-containing protein [Streptomyces hypolithicus]